MIRSGRKPNGMRIQDIGEFWHLSPVSSPARCGITGVGAKGPPLRRPATLSARLADFSRAGREKPSSQRLWALSYKDVSAGIAQGTQLTPVGQRNRLIEFACPAPVANGW